MNLKQYCEKHNITQSELANKVGIDASYVTHIIKGRKIPSVSIALSIEETTGGEVSAIELLKLNRK